MAVTIKSKRKKPNAWEVIKAIRIVADEIGAPEIYHDQDSGDFNLILAEILLPENPNEDPRDYFEFPKFLDPKAMKDWPPLSHSPISDKLQRVVDRVRLKFPSLKNK